MNTETNFDSLSRGGVNNAKVDSTDINKSEVLRATER